MEPYPKVKIVEKSVAVPESVHIYNAQTSGIKHKSMVTSALKVAWALSLLVNS